MWAGQGELRNEMQAIQSELRQEMKAGQSELRAGQTEIRKDLKSLEVRLAVVEQRPPRPPAESGESAAGPAPTVLLDDRSGSLRKSLLQARTVTARIKPMATGGPNH